MPEKVTYSKTHKNIHVKSTGDISAKDVKHSISEIVKIRNEKNLADVLVDQTDATSFPSDATSFNLGSDVAFTLKGMNIAIVHSGMVKKDLEFFEKVTQVRGGNLRIFESKDSALDWLESQSKQVANS